MGCEAICCIDQILKYIWYLHSNTIKNLMRRQRVWQANCPVAALGLHAVLPCFDLQNFLSTYMELHAAEWIILQMNRRGKGAQLQLRTNRRQHSHTEMCDSTHKVTNPSLIHPWHLKVPEFLFKNLTFKLCHWEATVDFLCYQYKV